MPDPVPPTENLNLRVAMEILGAGYKVTPDSDHVLAGLVVATATVLIELGYAMHDARTILSKRHPAGGER